LKLNHEISDDISLRKIDTAATDSKSCSNSQSFNTKRLGKSEGRRKRKNVLIRKLTKRGSKAKKSTKSLIKTENECIHEKVEEENWDTVLITPEKRYFNNPLASSIIETSGKKRLSSLIKPVSEMILLQKSIYEGRPMTVFFQYPDYWGFVRQKENIVQYTQDEFRKQGFSLSFRVTGSTHVYNSVVNSMKNAGFAMISR